MACTQHSSMTAWRQHAGIALSQAQMQKHGVEAPLDWPFRERQTHGHMATHCQWGVALCVQELSLLYT